MWNWNSQLTKRFYVQRTWNRTNVELKLCTLFKNELYKNLKSNQCGIETIWSNWCCKRICPEIEPMWNWNTGKTYIGLAHNKPEIEPMWNWNWLYLRSNSIQNGLKSNQCGIETNFTCSYHFISFISWNRTNVELKLQIGDLSGGVVIIPEIEPMWNWNSYLKRFSEKSRVPEIEPTWNWNLR